MIAIAFLLAQSAVEPSMVARGQTVFAQNCSVGYCHGVGGAAGRGPRLRGRNLPKDYLDRVTHEGIPSSAMPAWKGRLSDADIRAVVEYVSMLSAATDAPPPMMPMPAGEGPATARSFNGPPEAGRGFALFFDPTRDHCGVCHSMGGRGVAIAPDLAETVSKSQADAIALIRSTGARKVVRVKLNDGESFAALRGSETKDTVKLAMGLVATMTALVLGLLVASAKGSYDAQRNQLIQMAAKFAFLDRAISYSFRDAFQRLANFPDQVRDGQ